MTRFFKYNFKIKIDTILLYFIGIHDNFLLSYRLHFRTHFGGYFIICITCLNLNVRNVLQCDGIVQ